MMKICKEKQIKIAFRLEINPGKSEIIRALDSSIYVQISGEDLFLETQDLLNPIIISDPYTFMMARTGTTVLYNEPPV